ncbi:MAG: aspartate aminotransferase [Salibacteraceae bacterium]|jgi:aspartate aminotransferase
MSNKVSNRVNNLSESQTLAMAAKSRELKMQGVDIISLSLGEPDFDTPDFIKDAAHQAIKENFTHYPPVAGYDDVREAIAYKFKRDNNLEYTAKNILISTGAKQSLMNVVLSLVNPGEEILLPAPYWVSYFAMAEVAEATPIIIPTTIESDFKITPAQLKANLTEKSKLMIFSSPCNPSGSVYTIAELEALAEVVADREDFYIISDEIYEHINFTGKHASMGTIDSLKDKVITVNGLAKGFAMTGWRLGYIGAPEWIVKAAAKIQGQFTSGANTIAQKAAKAAVLADPSVTLEMQSTFLRRRDLVLKELGKIDGLKLNIPQGAFYVFPDVSSYFGKSHENYDIKNASDLCLYLLNEALVALVTGEAFGNPNSVRLSYAASDEQLVEATNRIKVALDKLQ